MSDPTRLHSVSQALGEAFRRASDRRRQQAVLTACQIAVSSTGLQGDEIDATFRLLRGGGDKDVLRRQLEQLSANLDDEYFRLGERHDPPSKKESLHQFFKARAASALAFALSSKSEQLHEAIYEAIIASDSREEIIRSVELALAEENQVPR